MITGGQTHLGRQNHRHTRMPQGDETAFTLPWTCFPPLQHAHSTPLWHGLEGGAETPERAQASQRFKMSDVLTPPKAKLFDMI
jgi:hypothetical protein